MSRHDHVPRITEGDIVIDRSCDVFSSGMHGIEDITYTLKENSILRRRASAVVEEATGMPIPPIGQIKYYARTMLKVKRSISGKLRTNTILVQETVDFTYGEYIAAIYLSKSEIKSVCKAIDQQREKGPAIEYANQVCKDA